MRPLEAPPGRPRRPRAPRPAGPAPWPGAVEERCELTPVWPVKLASPGRDGLVRRQGTVQERLLHTPEGDPVVVRTAHPAPDRIVVGARADSREAAVWGLDRARRATRADEDLRAFCERFADDPLIGASVRSAPWLRPRLRPIAWEALAWAVCEQLITFDEAVAIQRRLIRRFGRRCATTGLWDSPSPEALAAAAPVEIQACGLSHGRSVALRRCAIEVASGRVDLDHPDHEAGWTRLRAIPGIGSWTVDILATHGQGRLDRVPAGDLSYVKVIGRLLAGGDPRVRATEDEVRAFFAPYQPFSALAGVHVLRTVGYGPPSAHVRMPA